MRFGEPYTDAIPPGVLQCYEMVVETEKQLVSEIRGTRGETIPHIYTVSSSFSRLSVGACCVYSRAGAVRGPAP